MTKPYAIWGSACGLLWFPTLEEARERALAVVKEVESGTRTVTVYKLVVEYVGEVLPQQVRVTCLPA